MREPYLRLPNRSNTRKRLEMVVGQSVSHSTPSKTVAGVLALEGKREPGPHHQTKDTGERAEIASERRIRSWLSRLAPNVSGVSRRDGGIRLVTLPAAEIRLESRSHLQRLRDRWYSRNRCLSK
jgi:hypothetical protein